MESREAAVEPPDAALPHDEDPGRLRGAFEAVCNNYGGPQQFLKARLGSKEAQIKFAKQLRATLPPVMDKTYCHDWPLPAIREEDMASTPALVVHLSVLGYDLACTTKHPPLAETCRKIMEEVLVDGFVTASEPLKVMSLGTHDVDFLPSSSEGHLHAAWQDQAATVPDMTIPSASLGYVKGMARATTILALLYILIEDGVDLAVHYPKIYSTASAVNVYHLQYVDKAAVAFANARFSVRGSIRRAPTVWVLVNVWLLPLLSWGWCVGLPVCNKLPGRRLCSHLDGMFLGSHHP